MGVYKKIKKVFSSFHGKLLSKKNENSEPSPSDELAAGTVYGAVAGATKGVAEVVSKGTTKENVNQVCSLCKRPHETVEEIMTRNIALGTAAGTTFGAVRTMLRASMETAREARNLADKAYPVRSMPGFHLTMTDKQSNVRKPLQVFRRKKLGD